MKVKLVVLDLLTVPPNFKEGLIFDVDNVTVIKNSEEINLRNKTSEDDSKIDLMELLKQEQDVLGRFYF